LKATLGAGMGLGVGTLAMSVTTPTTFPEIVTLGVELPGDRRIAGPGDRGSSADERKRTDLSAAFVSHVKLVDPFRTGQIRGRDRRALLGHATGRH